MAESYSPQPNDQTGRETSEFRERAERAERERDRLQRENERLRQQIDHLKRQLDDARRAGVRQAAPFAKPLRPNPKRPGRHAGPTYGPKAHRPVPGPVNETYDAPIPAVCPDCGGPVVETGVASQYQEELPVVYANSITRDETDADSGAEVVRDIHFLKGYTVFNVEQIEGLPAQYAAPVSPRLDVSARIARAERFFAATGAILAHNGNRAFYRPSTDSIVMPPFETFRDAVSYYATLGHEAIHWTAHESRLARDFGTKRFESEGYAIEELVAELGAAFLCADLDLTLEPREDHASYIAHWLEVLKSDNRAIFAAASHAQRAVDFINGLQPASAV